MRLICITGMHRSGTSLTTRVINLLGVDIGPETDHDTNYFDNPKGHFESQRMLDVGKAIMADLGGSWDNPPTLPTGWLESPDAETHRAAATSAVRELFSDEGECAWKDPRSAILMPFWRSVVPVYRTVLCVRQPDEVAASLAARNGFGPEKSASLWLRYTADARRHAPEHLMVDYRDYFDDLDGVIGSVCDYLKLAEPDDDTRLTIEQFVDEKDRHHDERDRSDGPIMTLATRVYESLRSGDSDEVDVVLDAWHAHDGTRFAQHLATERSIAQVRERDDEAVVLRGEIDDGARRERGLEKAVADGTAASERLGARVEELESQREDLRRQREELKGQIEDLRRSVDDQRTEIELQRTRADAGDQSQRALAASEASRLAAEAARADAEAGHLTAVEDAAATNAMLGDVTRQLHDVSALHRREVLDHTTLTARLREERDKAWAEAAAERGRRRELQRRYDRITNGRAFRASERIRTTVKPVVKPAIGPAKAIRRRLR